MSLDYTFVQAADCQHAIDFALTTRKLLFPEIYHGQIPADLADFEAHYLDAVSGCFIVVKDAGKLIGTIAYRAYDGRFDLNIPCHAVEVVKLFVLAEYRRRGIASRLCQQLFQHAKAQGIDHVYLHTHPFLPAAELFWNLQGFNTIKVEQIQHYLTIHMSKKI